MGEAQAESGGSTLAKPLLLAAKTPSMAGLTRPLQRQSRIGPTRLSSPFRGPRTPKLGTATAPISLATPLEAIRKGLGPNGLSLP